MPQGGSSLPTNGQIAAVSSMQEVEADTADAEGAGDLNSILLPGGSLPKNVRQFSVSYKKSALDGYVAPTTPGAARGAHLLPLCARWVKQHSPACAAASIAGAWNIVHGLPCVVDAA